MKKNGKEKKQLIETWENICMINYLLIVDINYYLENMQK